MPSDIQKPIQWIHQIEHMYTIYRESTSKNMRYCGDEPKLTDPFIPVYEKLVVIVYELQSKLLQNTNSTTCGHCYS